MSQNCPVLIGDIGGTNVRLSIFRISKDINVSNEIVDKGKLPTQKYPSLEAAIEEYLSKFKNTENYPHYAVIGVPGPVKNNEILGLVNIPHWPKSNGEEFAKKLNIKQFVFLNDFTCNAYGVQTKLKLDEDYIVLNDVPTQKDEVIGIIGPGSGLGMSFLIKEPGNEYYTIGSSEGGGRDYSPKSEFNLKLRQFIKEEVGLKNVPLGKMCSARRMVAANFVE